MARIESILGKANRANHRDRSPSGSFQAELTGLRQPARERPNTLSLAFLSFLSPLSVVCFDVYAAAIRFAMHLATAFPGIVTSIMAVP
jgi:hypothetical protein